MCWKCIIHLAIFSCFHRKLCSYFPPALPQRFLVTPARVWCSTSAVQCVLKPATVFKPVERYVGTLLPHPPAAVAAALIPQQGRMGMCRTQLDRDASSRVWPAVSVRPTRSFTRDAVSHPGSVH